MNIVLFGSTDLTQAVANFLYDNNHIISAIVTVPSTFKISYRPEGVNNARFVDLAGWAKERKISTIVYENVSQLKIDLLKLNEINLGLVVGWYHMLPKQIRELCSLACVGIHASLLPKLRGGAPLNWAILTNQNETGVSLFELTDGVDDGLLYAQDKFPIDPMDTVTDLIQKTEISIMNILQRELPNFADKKTVKYEQQGVPSYCGQRIPEDSLIDWSRSSEEIVRLIRASTHPYAGAYTYIFENKVIIWEAKIYNELEIHGAPGQVVYNKPSSIIVACGKGAIEITNLETPQTLKTHYRFTSNKK